MGEGRAGLEGELCSRDWLWGRAGQVGGEVQGEVPVAVTEGL